MNQKEAEHVIGKTIFALLIFAGGIALAVWLYKNNPDIRELNAAMKEAEEINDKWIAKIRKGTDDVIRMATVGMTPSEKRRYDADKLEDQQRRIEELHREAVMIERELDGKK